MAPPKVTLKDHLRRSRGRAVAARRRDAFVTASLAVAGAACTGGALSPVVRGDGPIAASDVIFRVTGGMFVAAGHVVAPPVG